MRSALICVFCSLTCVVTVPAQQKRVERGAATTVISGHVYCADTNAPARMATVILEPAAALEAITPGNQKPVASQGQSVDTLLDGSFSIRHVAPGSYYVIASQAGYAPPLAALYAPATDRTMTEVDVRRKVLESLPRITVEPSLPVTVNVTIERGAAISGTVSWDDGSPAAGIRVSLLVHWKDQWINIPSNPSEKWSYSTETDDKGEYRISGLPPGEYMLEGEISTSNSSYLVSENGSTGMSRSSVYSLDIYPGGKTRRKDAVPLTITAGEELDGEDIQIPLSKLHTVHGNLVAARDGHVLNGGEAFLLYPDDKSMAGKASLGADEDGFTFSFVPEGDYILRVEQAADNEYRQIPNAPGTVPSTRTETHTLRRYGTTQQRVQVLGETAGLAISVPDSQEAKSQTP